MNTGTYSRGIYRGVELQTTEVCSLSVDTARCSILCRGHAEFFSLHVSPTHILLTLVPPMGAYLCVSLTSSQKELSHQETDLCAEVIQASGLLEVLWLRKSSLAGALCTHGGKISFCRPQHNVYMNNN